jgi:peptidoglycan glycosyltransferase
VNSPLRRAAAFCLLLFALLLINANYIQVVKADEYNNKPGNQRLLLAEYNRERGAILVDGTKIAYSVPTGDKLKYLRRYSDGPMYAAVTGYYSLRYGSAGLERIENSILSGTDDRLFVRRVTELLTGEESKGGSVLLTLNAKAQEAAYKDLQGKKGAVVAIEPKTGKVLALATSPSYDPSTLSSHSYNLMTEAWNKLQKDDDHPMEDKAVAKTYPPGSTFKIVTLAAALMSGRYTPDTNVPGPASIPLPQSTVSLPNENGEVCADGNPTLTVALELSCNTVYARVGMDLGQDAVRQQAEQFWFDNNVKVPITSATSVFPDKLDKAQTALSSIGQFDVRATPLQMAMVASAIGNQGKLMTPYLVDEIRAPDLSTLDKTEPKELRQSVTPEVAGQLTQMMQAVVTDGTGKNAQIDGVSVAGKTGTAQHGKGTKPHAWFISFAPAEDAKVAVAVVIEDGAADSNDISGGRLAAPIAKDVIQAVLNS